MKSARSTSQAPFVPLPELLRISTDSVATVPAIMRWLAQFPPQDRAVATDLVLGLRFVRRKTFSDWVRHSLTTLDPSIKTAVYAVRKLNGDRTIWADGKNGALLPRPAKSLGSEDSALALLSDAKRLNPHLLDSPSLCELRKQQVRTVVLLDDVIGSGRRIAKFANAMLAHPTFLSWWSYGLVRFHVMSYVRDRSSEQRIIKGLTGSDHVIRKHRVSEKVFFESEYVLSPGMQVDRWGESADSIKKLCRDTPRRSQESSIGVWQDDGQRARRKQRAEQYSGCSVVRPGRGPEVGSALPEPNLSRMA